MVTLEGIVLWNNQPDREAFGLVRKGVGKSTVLRAVEKPYPKVNPIQSIVHQSLLGVCLEQILSQEHTDAQRGENAQMCPVWQIIWKRFLIDASHENPQRRKAVQVWTVQQDLQSTFQSQDTSANSHY